VTLAVAGFVPEDLSITTQANKLTVTGRKADAENVEYRSDARGARRDETAAHRDW
jgi:HSP20 family molecular chaperone IbpA